MARDERAAHVDRYTVGTGNIITGGTVTNSPITNLGGKHGRADVTNAPSPDRQPPWLPRLRDELARIGFSLEAEYDPAISVEDRDDAVETVRALQAEVADAQASGQADVRSFRRRVRELIGVLAPVAEVIGGVAALEAIVQHL
jgi:hypothetical protein